jgi:nucleobase transporter 1/2
MEGLGCVFAGIMGSGGGLTSYSENIGAIGITRVASRRVIQAASLLMIVLAVFVKLSAVFATIPIPIIGGILMTMFGVCCAVGLSTLQFVDLNSSRNLFILGSSLFLGLSIPKWVLDHPGYIRTGSDSFDQVIYVLMSTSMFVGGAIGCFLDNTIPGTDEERGITKWLKKEKAVRGQKSVYDLPKGMNDFITKISFLQFVPVSPTYRGSEVSRRVSKAATRLKKRCKKTEEGPSSELSSNDVQMTQQPPTHVV